MEIKNELVSVGAETSPKNEISPDISNNDYTPKMAGCQSPAKMYDFDNGAVRLEYSGRRYHVYIGEEEQGCGYNDVQLSNPCIAVMLFTSCISSYLSEKVKSYLVSRGYNRIMGCKVCLSCTECKACGLNTAENLCRLYEDGS